MEKTFSQALRDLINQYTASGTPKHEIISALAVAESPHEIRAAQEAAARKAEEEREEEGDEKDADDEGEEGDDE